MSYIGLEHVEPHTGNLLGFVPAGTMSSSAVRFRQGDVLYGRMRPYLNKVVRPRMDGLASAEFVVLPPSRTIEQDFLARRIMAADFVEFACRQYEGDRPRVKFDQLSTFKILLPPLAEQRRIATAIDVLLSDLEIACRELEAASAKLTQYRQSLLKAAVEGRLTAEWRAQNPPKETGAELLARILHERRADWETRQLEKFRRQGKEPPKGWAAMYPEPAIPVVEPGHQLPEGWAWATIDQLAALITSGSRGWAEYYSNDGATFIRSQNISKDWLDLSDVAYVCIPTSGEGARTRVRNGDLLLTITGANVGRSARVEIDLDEAYVSQHVALIRPVLRDLAALLHAYLITQSGGRRALDNLAYGAGKPGLNLEQVRSISVPLPPLEELHQVMASLDAQLRAVGERGNDIRRLVRLAAAQRQNILRAAFSGQLVPQDPNDEPASVLLERIRAAREHIAPASRRNKPRARAAA